VDEVDRVGQRPERLQCVAGTKLDAIAQAGCRDVFRRMSASALKALLPALEAETD
jgi:hypothetical protein